MARFYQTGQTDFLDYTLPGSRSNTPGTARVSSPFGALEALPEDRARLEELINEYDAEIGEVANVLRGNPNAIQQVKPRLTELQNRIRDDYFTGELAAIRDRLSTYRTVEENIRKTIKDPFVAENAIREIGIPELGFDPGTRNYGRIAAPDVVQPFDENAKRQWIETAENTIKDEILSKVDDTRKLDKYSSLLTLGEEVGVGRDKVLQSLVGRVTPDMIRAENQLHRYRGENIDENQFYDPQTGEFNLDTTYGRMLDSVVTGLTRKSSKTQQIKYQDEEGLINARERAQRGTMLFGKKLERNDAQRFAEKLLEMHSGNPQAYQRKELSGKVGSTAKSPFDFENFGGVTTEYTPSPDQIFKDDILQGVKTKDGYVIEEVIGSSSERPKVVLMKPKKGFDGKDVPGEFEREERPFDIDFVEQALGTKFAEQVADYLGEEKQALDTERNIIPKGKATKKVAGTE